MTDEMKQEYTRRISQATPTLLTAIVLEVAGAYLEEAKENIENKAVCKVACQNALRCVQTLQNTLKMQYEVSHNLFSLYVYVESEMMRGEVKGQTKNFDNAIEVLRALQKSFETISPQDKEGSVMQNVDCVYTGLTYGSDGQGNKFLESSSARGFFA